MALSSDTANTQLIRQKKIHLWNQLRVEADPTEVKVYQHGADGLRYDARVRVCHDDRTWWFGVDGEDRVAELIDGPRPAPEWIEDIVQHLGVEEVEI